MAYRTIQLYKYIKLPDLGWHYCKAVFHENNRIKAHAVKTPVGEQTIKDGNHCLYYNRKWEPVDNNPAKAQRLLLKKRGELLAVANGGTVVQAQEEGPKVSGTLQIAFEAWVQDFIDGGAHADTIAAKRLVAKDFQTSCKVKTLAAATRQMCLPFGAKLFLYIAGRNDTSPTTHACLDRRFEFVFLHRCTNSAIRVPRARTRNSTTFPRNRNSFKMAVEEALAGAKARAFIANRHPS
ncbi:MAG: hypothetical protein ABSG62_09310 [Terracidiphilus sp.]